MRKIILILGCAVALTACTTEQLERVESTTNALCQSVPLAQVAYNVAVQNHDNETVNQILNTIRVSCPAVLTLLHTYQQPAPPLPAITPERG